MRYLDICPTSIETCSLVVSIRIDSIPIVEEIVLLNRKYGTEDTATNIRTTNLPSLACQVALRLYFSHASLRSECLWKVQTVKVIHWFHNQVQIQFTQELHRYYITFRS